MFGGFELVLDDDATTVLVFCYQIYLEIASKGFPLWIG